MAGLTSRAEGVGDGDDSGDDAGAPWFLQKPNINQNIIIIILGLSEILCLNHPSSSPTIY